MKNKNNVKILLLVALICTLLIGISACTNIESREETKDEKSYSSSLEERISAEISGEDQISVRPDYLPEEMFSRLPTFPEDFYQVRELVWLGKITDLGSLSSAYWMQPEFFPKFEETGLPLLQNPPDDRWGAYGIAVYPGDSVSTIVAGESLDLYFFIKSGYLVETYQGIKLGVSYPTSANIESAVELADGSKAVQQDPTEVSEYFKTIIDPDLFMLEPNFPVYNLEGTKMVKITIQVSEDTPAGNYVIGVDTGEVPAEYEQDWLMEYLNLYTSGGMTKLDRPYYQAFISVVEE